MAALTHADGPLRSERAIGVVAGQARLVLR